MTRQSGRELDEVKRAAWKAREEVLKEVVEVEKAAEEPSSWA